MVGAVAAGDQIEVGIGKRQRAGMALQRVQALRQSALNCALLHHLQHGRGRIQRTDLRDGRQRSQRKTEMAATTAGIEHLPAGIGSRQGGDQLAGARQIRAGGMDGAAGVGLGAGLVLLLHDIVVIAGWSGHGGWLLKDDACQLTPD